MERFDERQIRYAGTELRRLIDVTAIKAQRVSQVSRPSAEKSQIQGPNDNSSPGQLFLPLDQPYYVLTSPAPLSHHHIPSLLTCASKHVPIPQRYPY